MILARGLSEDQGLMADFERKALLLNSRRGFDTILGGDNAEEVFRDSEDQYFSSSTNVDVFDIRNGQGSFQEGLNDEGLRRSIEVAYYSHKMRSDNKV